MPGTGSIGFLSLLLAIALVVGGLAKADDVDLQGENRPAAETPMQALDRGIRLINEDSARSLEIADALIEAGESGDTTVDLNQAHLLRAVARLQIASPTKHARQKLRRTLRKYERAGRSETELSRLAWLALSDADSEAYDWKNARVSSARAHAVTLMVAPSKTQDLQRTKVHEAIAILCPGCQTAFFTPRWVRQKRAVRASQTLEAALDLFPPQDPDNVNPGYATALAWWGAVSALAQTEGFVLQGKPATQTQSAHREHPKAPHPRWIVPSRTDEECGFERASFVSPEYPVGAIRRGHVGAAFVMYDLTEEGRVTDVRFLAEVPTELFAPSILKAMESWRVNVPADAPEMCLQNRTTTFQFMLKSAVPQWMSGTIGRI